MRIAQVAPLYESVPPKLYGGTERVVSYLTEELVHQGHDVTLFASGDSVTQARLITPSSRSLRLDPDCIDRLAPHLAMVDQVLQRADHFDVLHFHIDYMHYPASRYCSVPHVTTLHGRLDLRDLLPLYRQFPDVPVISISDAQRQPLPWLNWQGTVYHGLPDDLYRFHAVGGDYLAFVGRISPEKRVDRAIEIARRAGCRLKIAAKVDQADHCYFEETIRPLLDAPGIEFIGEIGEEAKDEFIGNAAALLFPVDWPEPFGLVMIEAMACGTPVIAWRCGSVPEVIDEGVSGTICDTIDQAVAAVQQIDRFDRHTCRQQFQRRFRAARMAEDYVQIYERLVERSPRKPRDNYGRDHPRPGSVLHSGHVVPRR
jgi:glycosyltransferase involved in cell wall biosynthesis